MSAPAGPSVWRKSLQSAFVLLRVGLRLFILLACLILVVGAGFAWIVATESGGRFAAAQLQRHVDGLQLQGWQGRVWDDWRLQRISLDRPGVHFVAEAMHLQWSATRLLAGSVDIADIEAERVEFAVASTGDKAKPEPDSLALSLPVKIQSLRVGVLQIAAFDGSKLVRDPKLAFRQLRGRYAASGEVHRLDDFSVETAYGVLAGKASIGVSRPFSLMATAQLSGGASEPGPLRAVILKAQADGSLEQLHLKVDASGGDANGVAELVLLPFAPVPVKQARIALQGIDPAAFNTQAPHALLSLRADLVPDPAVATADPLDWSVVGPLEILNSRAGAADGGLLPIERFAAKLSWSQRRLQLSDLDVRLPGEGTLKGSATWQASAQSRLGQLETKLRVAKLDPHQLWHAAREVRIAGDVDVSGNERQQRFLVDLAAEGIQLKANAVQQDGAIVLNRAELLAGSAKIDLRGKLALLKERAFDLQGHMSRVDPNVFLTSTPHGDLNARFDIRGILAPDWRATATIELGDSSFAGYPVAGTGRGTASADSLSKVDINLNVLGNLVQVQGDFGHPADRLQFHVDAPALERLSPQIAGRLKAEGVVGGSLQEPHGGFSLRGEQLRLGGGVRIATFEARADLRPGADGAVDASVVLSGLQAGGDTELASSVKLAAQGSRRAHEISLSAKLMQGESLEAGLAGGYADGRWTGVLHGFKATGPIVLSLQKPARLTMAPDQISLGEASLAAENGMLQLQQTEWTPAKVVAKGKVSGVQLGFSFDEYQRTVFRGRSLQLGGDWDISLGEQPRGLVRVFRESGDFILQGDSPVAMGLENFDINLAAQDGRVVLSAMANGTRIGSLNAVVSTATRGRGSATRIDRDAPLVGVINVAVPSISWLGPLLSQNLRTDGSLEGQASMVGSLAKPASRGQITGAGLSIGLADEGLRLSDGNMLISFDAARVRLESLSFRSDNALAAPDARLAGVAAAAKTGHLTGNGEVALPSGIGAFVFTADKVAAMQRKDQWALVSGTADFDTGWDHIDLNARLKADGGFVGVPRRGAPELSDDVVVRGRKLPPSQRVNVSAEVYFDFGDDFILRAYGIDTYLAGQMRVRLAQGERAQAIGSVRAKDGVFDAYGQKLAIEIGIVNFQGPIDNPGLNIVALRKGLAVEAGVEVSGTAQRPRVRLVSDPPVPETEKLSWVLLGRGTEPGSADVGLLVTAAGAMLGGEGEGLATRVARSFGLDEVSVGQASDTSRPLQSRVAGSSGGTTAAAATDEFGGQVVTVGKRLSNRAYIGFEQNLLGTESVVRLTYTLSRYLSLIAKAGTENALDLHYAISFR